MVVSSRRAAPIAAVVDARLHTFDRDTTDAADVVGAHEQPSRGPGYADIVVDVQTEIEIARPRAEVAGYASDPDNATAWYENIERIEWKSPKPLARGARIAFVARFLGRRLAYTYEVRDLVPGERFVMSTAEGPFPMETTYTWQDAADGGTRMTLRNRGTPSGFSRLVAPFMARAMRRANRKDLQRLKEILEARGDS
jgi:Polyketide cyclase / dehydrase and lipid transport